MVEALWRLEGHTPVGGGGHLSAGGNPMLVTLGRGGFQTGTGLTLVGGRDSPLTLGPLLLVSIVRRHWPVCVGGGF